MAVFTDGRITLTAQEGLWPGGPADGPLFERARPYRAFGPSAARPSTEDALLATVGDQGGVGLLAPLITYVDLRELLRLPLDVAYLQVAGRRRRPRPGALGRLRALRPLLPRGGRGRPGAFSPSSPPPSGWW